MTDNICGSCSYKNNLKDVNSPGFRCGFQHIAWIPGFSLSSTVLALASTISTAVLGRNSAQDRKNIQQLILFQLQESAGESLLGRDL